MSTGNPTPLRIGATGTLEGRHYRIASRMVMAMEQDGETYQWNEFNVVDGFGRAAILVHEEGEHGPEWRLFKPFEPRQPLPASEAALKSVGDTIELDGVRRRVSLVDQSRVAFIEGAAPEGVATGDIANYFNVNTDDGMLVVSWTGDEVEYFEGRRIGEAAVYRAFGVTPTPSTLHTLSRSFAGAAGPGASVPWKLILGLGAVIVMVLVQLLGPRGCARAPGVPEPPAKRAAPSLRLAKDAQGSLAGQTYRITGEAMVEINRVGARHARREYQLSNDAGQRALLVHGLNGGAHEWHLLTPQAAPFAWTPFEAAARRRGAAIDWAGAPLRVTDLFQSKRLAVDGPPQTWPELQYGLLARGQDDVLMARWTETRIDYYRGRPVPEREVLSAFRPR